MNVITNNAIIELNSYFLRVDVSLIEGLPFKVSSLFQFIGELLEDEEGIYLKARVARNIDGIDLPLYEKVLELK